MKKLIAIGKDIHGKTHEFTVLDGVLLCGNRQLTELKMPEGVKWVSCCLNQLTELKLPEGVTHVHCWGNHLTELKIPEGVTHVFCYDNKITHLDIPESVTYLRCDKKVTGLDRYVGKVEMKLR